MTAASHFNSNNIPTENMVYMTPDGDKLCVTHALRYILHMARRQVTGYKNSYGEKCDICGKPLDGT